jgi:hypothetical protein
LEVGRGKDEGNQLGRVPCYPGPFSYPYSPNVLEEVFSEVGIAPVRDRSRVPVSRLGQKVESRQRNALREMSRPRRRR